VGLGPLGVGFPGAIVGKVFLSPYQCCQLEVFGGPGASKSEKSQSEKYNPINLAGPQSNIKRSYGESTYMNHVSLSSLCLVVAAGRKIAFIVYTC